MSIEVRSNKTEVTRKNYPLIMKDLTDLVPHEMTINSELEKFKQSIIETRQLNWPMIIDKKTMLILDGHHRYRGLMELGYKNVPAVELDYMDDEVVKVGTWYPLLNVSVNEVISQLEGIKITNTTKLDPQMLESREVTAYIGNNNNLYKLAGHRERVFQVIRDRWLDKIQYYDDSQICLEHTNSEQTAIIAWSYSKLEIIRHGLAGKLYLPKTTRHFMKYEVMRCNTSIDDLE